MSESDDNLQSAKKIMNAKQRTRPLQHSQESPLLLTDVNSQFPLDRIKNIRGRSYIQKQYHKLTSETMIKYIIMMKNIVRKKAIPRPVPKMMQTLQCCSLQQMLNHDVLAPHQPQRMSKTMIYKLQNPDLCHKRTLVLSFRTLFRKSNKLTLAFLKQSGLNYPLRNLRIGEALKCEKTVSSIFHNQRSTIKLQSAWLKSILI